MARDTERTRQLIIEKSALLFNRKGYAGTSLQDLTKSIGMTKGSIYGNFQNKNEVSLEAFKYNFGELLKRLTAYVGKKSNSVDQLLAITRFYREDFDMMNYLGGCPVMNAATDADDTNGQLSLEVSGALDAIIATIAVIIERGKKNNEITPAAVASDYAVLFFALIEGGILISKTTCKKKFLFGACDRIDKIINEELRK